MAKNMIPVSDILAMLDELPDEGAGNALMERVHAVKGSKLVLCGECASYVRMDGATFPGRCKRIGFWFPENFSCGYCQQTERKKRLRF